MLFGRSINCGLFKDSLTTPHEAQPGASLESSEGYFVLLIVVDSKLRTAIRICDKRDFLASVAVEREEGVSNRVIRDVSTTFVSQRVIEHHA